MWTYLFMHVHVTEKGSLDHNGWESYVHAKLGEGDLSFLPMNNAISLKAFRDEEERKSREATQLITETARAVASLTEKVDGLDGRLKTLQTLFAAHISSGAGLAEASEPGSSSPQKLAHPTHRGTSVRDARVSVTRC